MVNFPWGISRDRTTTSDTLKIFENYLLCTIMRFLISPNLASWPSVEGWPRREIKKAYNYIYKTWRRGVGHPLSCKPESNRASILYTYIYIYIYVYKINLHHSVSLPATQRRCKKKKERKKNYFMQQLTRCTLVLTPIESER